MPDIEKREQKFEKINRAFTAVYLLFCLALIVVYAIRRDGYHLGISLGTLLVPPAIALFYRITRLQPVHQLNFLIMAFTSLAYPLGSCVDFYRILPGFDKVAHTLSGTFVSILCATLYFALKKNRRIEPDDAALVVAFTFFGSMAVAGLWEIGEYLASGIVGLDLQRVAATGVSDSMQDMIVCMIGTLAALPSVARLTKGRPNLLTGGIAAFVQKKLPA